MCKQCEIKPVYEFTNKRKLCGSCFVRYFHKKVLYTIRRFGMIPKGSVVGYDGDDAVLEDVLEMFGEKAIVKVKSFSMRGVAYGDNSIKAERHDKVWRGAKIDLIAISSTLDSESDKIIHELIKGDIKKLKSGPVEGNVIKPLYLFLDEEVKLYAKLRGLKYSQAKKKGDSIGLFVEDMEKKHPELKRAVVNGWLGLD